MTLRPTSIFIVVLFFVMFLAGVLPRTLTRATVIEVLPATNIAVPPTSSHEITHTPEQVYTELNTFITAVMNGQPDQVVGVFAPDLFALPVMQQPKDQPTFVSADDQVLTQFGLPSQYGSTAILAHNFLSGKVFYTLEIGDEVALVYGDGQARYFRIQQILQFQATQPESSYSDFIDVADPNQQVISSGTLFQRIYTNAGQVVFQTCIDANGNPSWGRVFVIAEPISAFSMNTFAAEPVVYSN